MKVEVEARVIYTCFLSPEDEQMIREYAEENGCNLETAVWECCCCDNKVDLYHDSTESEFFTEEILDVEE